MIDVLILLVRIAITLSLYAFIAAIFYILIRDLRAVEGRQTAPPATHGQLTVAESTVGEALAVGHAFPLRSATLIGRAPTCDIVLPDSTASLEHAVIVLRDGKWWLADRRSRNGTQLNGSQVEHEMILSEGDLIQIGRVTLRFEPS